jgi:glycosyltransferase involved in cell wall biosynthesis
VAGKTIKVVWLCHFSSQEIQGLLKPSERIEEYAPWITEASRLFEFSNDIDLHIVSPHEYISSDRNFDLRGIHYHFFNAHIPFWGRGWPYFFKFDYWTDFLGNKIKIRKIIKEINPDIIHLHGVENAYYSSSIFQFQGLYPILITVQGFISHTTLERNYFYNKRIKTESRILKKFTHFGYRTIPMGKEIHKYNPNAKLHWHYYPVFKVSPIEIEKRFDVVFFARLSKDKGIEDLLKAISIVKKDLDGITVCIIGTAHPIYLDYLKDLATELKIFENIYWAGFLNSQADLFRIVSSSKISVLPTWHDIIPGTIIESMFLKLPVVSYSVGGIPEINDKEEYVTLVSKGDINALAEKILWLLKNPNIIIRQRERAYTRAVEMFDNTRIPVDLLKAYKEVIYEFKK